MAKLDEGRLFVLYRAQRALIERKMFLTHLMISWNTNHNTMGQLHWYVDRQSRGNDRCTQRSSSENKGCHTSTHCTETKELDLSLHDVLRNAVTTVNFVKVRATKFLSIHCTVWRDGLWVSFPAHAHWGEMAAQGENVNAPLQAKGGTAQIYLRQETRTGCAPQQ